MNIKDHLRAHQQRIGDLMDATIDEIERLEAEIERLRTALREIAEDPCIDSHDNAELARRALKAGRGAH